MNAYTFDNYAWITNTQYMSISTCRLMLTTTGIFGYQNIYEMGMCRDIKQ